MIPTVIVFIIHVTIDMMPVACEVTEISSRLVNRKCECFVLILFYYTTTVNDLSTMEQ